MNEHLTITQISKLFEISPHTIRFYEKEGLLTSVLRTEGGIRRYTMKSIIELEAIIVLRDSGIPLKEIKKIWHSNNSDEYEKMLKKSYLNITEEVKRLNVLKKKLKKSLDFRENYINCQIEISKRTKIVLSPIKEYDHQISLSPSKLYDYYMDNKKHLKNSGYGNIYLTQIDKTLLLCEEDKCKNETSLVFEEGSYVIYQYTGLLDNDSIEVAKEDIKKYVTSNNIEVSKIPLITLSDISAVAIGETEKEIIELSYKVIK